MTRRTPRLLLCLSLLLAAVGCSSSTDSGMTKEQARALVGKGDSSTDWCAILDWYGDGICDDFCVDPDPDCGTPDGGTACGGLLGWGCDDGQYCNFPEGAFCGAADQTGTCEAIPEVCTEQYAPVCGCDDQTYANDCFAAAAGVSVASQGECAPQGVSCGGFTAGPQPGCGEGEFCKYALGDICGAADAPGVCAAKPEACDAVYAPVCGCDGKTYSNECAANAQGVSISSEGACNGGGGTFVVGLGERCGGETQNGSPTCDTDAYCDYTLEDICGFADAQGTCKVRPEVCTAIYAPVCGCDGKTYASECVANGAGVSIQAQGACPSK